MELENKLDVLVKVELLSDYVKFLKNQDLIEMIKAEPSGEVIFEIIRAALSKEVETAFGTKDVSGPVSDSLAQARELAGAIRTLRTFVMEIERSQLVTILGQIFVKLGGQMPRAVPTVVSQVTETPRYSSETSQNDIQPLLEMGL